MTRQVTVVILRGIDDGCRGRPPRADEANAIDHMLHRGNRREPLFHKTEEFEPFRPNWIDFVAAPLTDTEQKEMQLIDFQRPALWRADLGCENGSTSRA